MRRDRSGSSKPFAGLLALGAAGCALAAVVVWRLSFLSTMPRPLADLYLEVADSGMALAPDGRTIAYIARKDEGSFMELRRVGERGARRLAGTRGAKSPFFSPDGRFLGFVDAFGLKRASLDSYAVEEIATVANVEEASFREDGSLLLASASGLFLVSGSGRMEALLGAHVRRALAIRGSDWIVFEVRDEKGASLEVLSLASGTRRTLLREASLPRFFPPHQLLFLRNSALWACRFDSATGEVRGDPVLMVPEVDWFDVAPNGTLAFRRPGVPRPRLRIVLHWNEELERMTSIEERADR